MKAKTIGSGQIYTELSRGKVYDDLYCIGKFKKFTIKLNKNALFDYKSLKQNDLFPTIEGNNISGNKITVSVHNTPSLKKYG